LVYSKQGGHLSPFPILIASILQIFHL
jgi:hypothetical protein